MKLSPRWIVITIIVTESKIIVTERKGESLMKSNKKMPAHASGGNNRKQLALAKRGKMAKGSMKSAKYKNHATDRKGTRKMSLNMMSD